MEKYMQAEYFDPKKPASFAGLDTFHKHVKEKYPKITKKIVENFLRKYDAYTLHKLPKANFKRSKIYIEKPYVMYDADLMDMQRHSKENDGDRFVLICIDIFSRYLKCIALKTKQGREVTTALAKIFADPKTPYPRILRTDTGSEFTNKLVSAYLYQNGVKHILARNTVHANYAERVIRTIKSKLYKFFTHKASFRWNDILDKVVYSYNNTQHSAIKMTPQSVNISTARQAWVNQFLLPVAKKVDLSRRGPKVSKNSLKPKKSLKTKFRYKVGATVRVSLQKHAFTRDFDQRWSGEYYIITKRFARDGLPIYKLTDLKEREVKGTFYQAQLSEISLSANTKHRVETILAKRTRKGRKQALVKWLFWPEEYNSWIDSKEVGAIRDLK